MHNYHSRSLGCGAASGHPLKHLVREYRGLTDNSSIRSDDDTTYNLEETRDVIKLPEA